MKRNINILFVALMIFALTACQTASPTPAGAQSVDVYKNQPDYWLTLNLPVGWKAYIGGTSLAKNVTITDDWKGYQAGNGTASSIIVTWLKPTEKSSAGDALKNALKRLDKMLREPMSEIALEDAKGQSYASVEYKGKSVLDGVSAAYYFVAVVSNGKRSILVMSTVEDYQEAKIKPVFHDVMKGIVIH